MASPLRFPGSVADLEDFEQFFDTHIMHGLRPKAPFLDMSDTLISMGSCFAANIHEALLASGFSKSVHYDIAESANSPFSLHKLMTILAAAADEDTPPTDRDIRWAGTFVRNIDVHGALETIQAARCAILTVGVAIAARDENGYPTHLSPTRCSLLDQELCHEFIGKSVALLKQVNPDIEIVLTVSPIPLSASPFRQFSAFTLDCMSKSFLRSGVAKLMAQDLEGVHYWPSFEATRWLSGHNDFKFGQSDGNPRHLDPDVIQRITRAFAHYYVKTAGAALPAVDG